MGVPPLGKKKYLWKCLFNGCPKKGKLTGLNGIHIAEYNANKQQFNVALFSPDGKEGCGKVTWTKIREAKTFNSSSNDNEKVVYLTFDDGPFDGTRNILLALKEKEIEATFFLVGEHALYHREKHAQTMETLKQYDNVLLANHSYSHANNVYSQYYSQPRKVLSDIEKNGKKLLSGRGNNVNSKIVRLPGRNIWGIGDYEFYSDLEQDARPSMELLVNEKNKVYGWDVEWHERVEKIKGRRVSYTKESPEYMAGLIEKCFNNHQTKFKNKCVVLMHDRMFYDATERAKLKKLIQLLKDKGYEFKKLDSFIN